LLELNKIIYNDDFFKTVLIKYGKKFRASQYELANEVKNAYDKNLKFVAEAEVGTGKSFAYLVPAFNKIRERNKPFLISTGTIVLQDQLITKDIPELSRYLLKEKYINRPLKSMIGKGKEHYICENRLVDFINNDSANSVVLDDIRKQYENDNFDRNDFPEVSDSVWNKINVQKCSPTKCKTTDCLYRKFRLDRQYNNYDFFVCNHHYLISCLKNSNFSIYDYSGVVIDEAHNFENAAFSILGDNKSLFNFIKCLNQASKKIGYQSNEISEAISTTHKLFEFIKKNTKVKSLKPELGWKYKIKINETIIDYARELRSLLSEVLIKVMDFSISLKKIQDKLSDDIEDLIDFTYSIVNKEDKIFWVQFENYKGFVPRLFYIPCNIDEILYKKLFTKEISIVLSSATMSTSKDPEGFDYFISSLGIDLVRTSTYKPPVSKPSPFKLTEQVGIYIEKEIKYKNIEDNAYKEYLDRKAKRILDIINATNGKSLVLFTSYEVMNYTHSIIEEQIINELKLDCYKQGDTPNLSILQCFAENVNSCLFATGSFWEGIDIKGPSLSCVILDKLPFPVIDPIIEYKKEKMKLEISEVLIPEMVIRLKQGVGRLIRDENDKGIIAIMDSRAVSKYNYVLKNSLPDYYILSSIKDIEMFLTTT